MGLRPRHDIGILWMLFDCFYLLLCIDEDLNPYGISLVKGVSSFWGAPGGSLMYPWDLYLCPGGECAGLLGASQIGKALSFDLNYCGFESRASISRI